MASSGRRGFYPTTLHAVSTLNDDESCSLAVSYRISGLNEELFRRRGID